MLPIQAFLFGIVEGLTEFLPISSTAHLILAARALSVAQTDALESFQIIIQLGAIAAVIVLYVKRVLANLKLVKPLLLSFIPTMLLGLVFYTLVKEFLLETFAVTIAGLAVGGLFLVIAEYISRHKVVTVQLIESLPALKAITIGISQAFAMVPGMSRSAMTISAGRLVGLSREHAVEYSFLLAVPVMISATVLDVYKSYHLITQSDWTNIGIGFVTAFITALVSMKWFINFAKKHSLSIFGWYRIILAVLLAVFVR